MNTAMQRGARANARQSSYDDLTEGLRGFPHKRHRGQRRSLLVVEDDDLHIRAAPQSLLRRRWRVSAVQEDELIV